MQTKLIEILFSATGWLTSVQIADKGKWRSASHVGVELQLMEKAGRVVRRKSPTAKQSNGMPATEWRHADKSFDGDSAPVVREGRVTETIVRTNPAVPNLSARIKELESETAEARIVFGNIRKTLGVGADTSVILAIQKLQSDMRGLTQRAEVAERNRDDLKKRAEAEHNDVLMWERTMLSLVDADSVSGVTDAINDMKSLLQQTGERADAHCHTLALIALNLESVEGDNLVKKVCKVMHERIHAPKIVATDAAQFVVKTPSKPPRFTKKQTNAHAAAMSAARQHGFAEVFALVPVGKAVRGAEWVAK